nr:MAG TPA: hypothetical protein [Caudoviricetes sp.]
MKAAAFYAAAFAVKISSNIYEEKITAVAVIGLVCKY